MSQFKNMLRTYTHFLQEQRGSNLAKNEEQRKKNPDWDLES